MKHSRRNLIKISSRALGAMVVPSKAMKASAQEVSAIVEVDTSSGFRFQSALQRVRLVRTRVAMAGSSPTWVKRT